MFALGSLSIDDNQQQLGSIKIFPNPAKDKLSLSYSLNKNAQIEIKLFTINGQLRSVLESSQQVAGSYTQEYKLSNYNLNPGIYILQVYIDNAPAAQEKLVILK